MGEKEFTAACMQLMFLAGSLDSGEFERLFKAILDDRAALVAHNAELEALLNQTVPIMLESVQLISTLAASQDKLRAWVRYEIKNKCALCWNRDMEPCPTFFCRYKYAKTLLEESNI